MRKALLIASISCFTLTGFTKYNTIKTITKTTVYVCGKSKIYHKVKTHSALGRCKSGITEFTETEAINSGKRVCKCRG
jgi:hypothetical protein